MNNFFKNTGHQLNAINKKYTISISYFDNHMKYMEYSVTHNTETKIKSLIFNQ